MPVSRRDLLLGLGGGAAGLALSPVPWKLLDDLAIFTQHRRALPIPPRGEVSFRPAVCPLCPAGCALRVRCYGPRPVSVVAEPNHPLGRGACALGLTLHQLAFHPLRLLAPAERRGTRLEPVSLQAAVAAMAGAIAEARKSGGSVMVLDRRPGRVVSQAWTELLAAVPSGVLATVPGEADTFEALAAPGDVALGIDLERTRTLLSFGAPVLDGWGRPARLRALRQGLRVVQADTWRSAERGARRRVAADHAGSGRSAGAVLGARAGDARPVTRRRARASGCQRVRAGAGGSPHRPRARAHRGARPGAPLRRPRSRDRRGRSGRRSSGEGRRARHRAAEHGARERGHPRRSRAAASAAGGGARRGSALHEARRRPSRIRPPGHPRQRRRRTRAALARARADAARRRARREPVALRSRAGAPRGIARAGPRAARGARRGAADGRRGARELRPRGPGAAQAARGDRARRARPSPRAGARRAPVRNRWRGSGRLARGTAAAPRGADPAGRVVDAGWPARRKGTAKRRPAIPTRRGRRSSPAVAGSTARSSRS